MSTKAKARSAPRRLSWKTASQRRNRPGSCPSSVTTHGINNTFLQQLNPYKALRSSAGAACTASIQDDNYERNVCITRLRLSGNHDAKSNLDSFDDDSLGADDDLENIISGIEGIRETVPALNPPATIDMTVTNDAHLILAPESGDDAGHDHAQHSGDGRSRRKRPLVGPVDFGNSHVLERDGRPHESPKCDLDIDRTTLDESDISGEEDETPFRDGDAKPKHNSMLEAGRGSLGTPGFDDCARRTSNKSPSAGIATTASSLDCPAHSKNTKEGSVEQSLGEMAEHDSQEQSKSHKIIDTSSATTPPRTKSHCIESKTTNHIPLEPLSSSFLPLTVIRREDKEPNGVYPFTEKTHYHQHHHQQQHDATNMIGVTNHHPNQADDTISTVTEQTDSPFIFTYKKSCDDDSVSQITSSIVAGSVGSSFFKNIPLGSGKLGSNKSGGTKGPSWTMGGRRMTTRKRGAVVAGTFGRDRTRQGGSVGNSDGTADGSLENGRSNLDEIAYALNAGPGTYRSRRVGKQDFGDLCTIDSEKSGVSRRRSHDHFDGKSNISALGMGGASCGGHSVASASGLSKSSSSGSRGLMEGFKMLARKAQHNAGRFFFPTSPKVTQRKKFDRSDSLDDLLLEEGAKTLPRRASFVDGTKEDDIDYFSRAMSISSNACHGSRSRASSHSSVRQKPSAIRVYMTILVVVTAFIVYKYFLERGDKTTNSRRGNANLRLPRFPLQNFEGRGDKYHEFGPIVNPELDRQEYARDEQHRNWPEYSASSEEVSGSESDRSRDALRMPFVFENIADFDAGPFQRGIDVPFYWHVPRSGGGTVNDVLGSCLKLVLASDAGGSGDFGQGALSFVNVDAYSPKGIQRAKNLDLITSGLADVVMSPLLHDAAALFTPTHNGRLFTMLRHPIERATSLFYFIQDTQWKEPKTRNDQFADISIENFYKQGLAENNWMTRFLTNQLTKAELTDEDLELAKNILKRKFLIGLLEEKTQSFERFQKYFGWSLPDDGCIQKKIEWTWPMKHRHVSVEEGSDAWFLIRAQNEYDIQLYEYAKEIFVQQESLIPV
ncbi:hypothetical protein HJC23_003271 [Cyclotella cryptica]|uniref:Sulfotransferase domain-containing protein n=1 Tax=Cyclotella cryptica TaxID=29204 RepID=A0ABD3QXS4_9STRA